MKSRRDCDCLCHSGKIVVHPVPCCDGMPGHVKGAPTSATSDNRRGQNSDAMPEFRKPTALERAFNRFFGLLVSLGIGLKHNYLLQVRGRKSGKLYSNPIDLLVFDGKQYLVAPRGRTQWVRNAEAAGQVALKKGSYRQSFQLKPIPDAAKPPLLKAYLDNFKPTVQRYFPVPAGSDVSAFVPIAAYYPVFELESIK